MRTITSDSKARIIALSIGYAALAVLLLGLGITNSAEAADLNPRPQLERLIQDQIAAELTVIDAKLASRFESLTTPGDEENTPSNGKTLQASNSRDAQPSVNDTGSSGGL